MALGVHTNGEFLSRALRHPAFLQGDTTTAFIERFGDELIGPEETAPGDPTSPEMAALFAALARMAAGAWREQPRWRNNPNRPRIERFALRERGASQHANEYTVSLTPAGAARYRGSCSSSRRGEWGVDVQVRRHADGRITAEVNGRALSAFVAHDGAHEWWVAAAGRTMTLTWLSPLPEPRRA